MAKAPLRVCITGAAGQIGYAIIPMICNGDMFGDDQPVILQLLDLDIAMEALGGVVMEIQDGSYPLVSGIVATSDPNEAYKKADAAVLLGAFPRKQGMERKDLMEKNISIFKVQGQAIERNANSSIKVLVVGNPANTNALVCSHYAPKVPKANFTAMTRLDHHRAQGQIALKTGACVGDVKNVIIWGNHSSTQVPCVDFATVDGKSVRSALNNDQYLDGEFVKTIQSRGAAIISARKASSALSAARAAVRHMRSWFLGTSPGEVVSMGVLSDANPYGIEAGLMYSFPCSCSGGSWAVAGGYELSASLKKAMKVTQDELCEEKQLAFSLL